METFMQGPLQCQQINYTQIRLFEAEKVDYDRMTKDQNDEMLKLKQ